VIKKTNVQHMKKSDASFRVRVRRKIYERKLREQWVNEIKAGPEDLSELKNPDAAKIYIQHAMSQSVKKRNKGMLLDALRKVANAVDNPRALRLIAISDGDFISVNDILLELGFCLQFDKLSKKEEQPAAQGRETR
jgi:hypothetical protein